jgi:hypothetical protein
MDRDSLPSFETPRKRAAPQDDVRLHRRDDSVAFECRRHAALD